MVLKYTWANQKTGEKALIDYVLINKPYKARLFDVAVLRYPAEEFSDHYLLESRVMVQDEYYSKRRRCGGPKEVIKLEDYVKEKSQKEFQMGITERC